MPHFLKETDFDKEAIQRIFAQALEMKVNRAETPNLLDRESWGMLFYKNSTRTRVSFEVGIHELGAHPVILNVGNMQIKRGESTADTAKVLSRYLHGLVIRCFDHSVLEDFAAEGSVPVVNALTDFLHPCQIYTDMFTLAERWSGGSYDLVESLAGKKLAFLGDTASNMANSWLLGGAHLGMEISLGGPAGYEPGEEILALLKKEGLEDRFTFSSDPLEAVKDADVLYTDVWVSMGDEAEAEARLAEMKPYAVTAELMAAAKTDAYFMHCLPAHPDEEVTQEVLDSPASIIFDQAENRLHVQKAILGELVT
ncbi:ornithine carbamoyltransferase [Rubellicoccus peritrichatus]|uniref:Ornithine carbamoyltransferase n=1 Tax=Rubellicoccus peritrichatus TaxID=3080537 RepID=A0AAQ3LCT0_9BACT|nr:ornithine carbamoyltransferase [Puniceicoccus sp. CR14]WOO42084.1 ornithine carbamoyltransferase [Puniceicoccus sp. CR14]